MSRQSFPLPPDWAERSISIVLIGAGGTGSQLADQLASLEATLRQLGHPGFVVTIHDGDTVSASNIGRQRFTRADIGSNKATLIVHRVNAFYGLAWRAEPRHFDVKRDGLWGFDLVITAVDKASFRAELGARYRAERMKALWLDTGNGADRGNVLLGHLGQPAEGGQKLPNVFDLYPELAAMTAVDDDLPSCSAEEAIQRQSWPTNRTAAMIATELLWTLIRAGRIDTHGAFFSLAPMTIQPIAIDPEAWAFMGYSEAA